MSKTIQREVLFDSVPSSLTRRSLLRAGVLCYGFNWLNVIAAEDKPQPLPGSLKNNPRLDAWLNLHPDGTVTMLTGKVELGQGILTALTQIVADELDVNISLIKVISGDTSLTPDEGVTSGSLSIQDSGTALRYACAEVRSMLMDAAAQKLGTNVGNLTTESGTVKQINSGVAGTGISIKYSELLSDVNYARTATARFAPKASAVHKLIGSELQRRDIPGKVSGKPMYVQDLRLPNMVHARVVRPPAPRATLSSVNIAPVLRLPGVLKVVQDGNFLGVIASREEQAIKASKVLRETCQWQTPKDLPPTGPALFEYMVNQKSQDDVVSQKTNPSFPGQVDKVIKRRYTRPYIAHASIGPSCAVAVWSSDSDPTNTRSNLRVWCHSQGVFPLRGDLSKALRLPSEQITVSHMEGSGCYGHNGADDVALDAALIARSVPGTPVRLQWMREDEFAWEPLGSPMVVELSAQLNDSGEITHWQHELWSYTHSTRPYDPDGCNLLASWYTNQPLKAGPARNIPQPSGGSDRNAIPLYEFPNQKVINHLIQNMPIRTSALRTLGAFCNVLAIESFMDELAVQSKQDPLTFRLRHLKDPRAVAVVERVAEMAHWRVGQEIPNWTDQNSKQTVGQERRGRGIGFAKYKNLAVYCAVVADVVVNTQTGFVRVDKAYAAVDAGLIINPNGLKNQIEGGLIQATSWSLMEHVDYDSERIKTTQWSDYPVLRFTDVPRIEVELINRPLERSLGVGEGAHGPMAAAIANAIFVACGQRLRETPLRPVANAASGSKSKKLKI